MENCALMQELISRMLDGDLNADEQAALAKHLESCEDCRKVYEAFAAVSAALGEELEEPPESLRENVMAEIRREEIRRKNRRPWWRAALAAAAVLALVLGLRYVPGLSPERVRMGAAATDFAAQSVEIEETEETAAEEEAAAEYAAAALPEAAKSAARSAPFAAEEPAPAAGITAGGAAESLADSAPAESAANGSANEIMLPQLTFAELLELLDGEPVELRLDQLGSLESVAVICRDSMLALFEYDGAWYYYVAADSAPRRSALTPGELRALAEG